MAGQTRSDAAIEFDQAIAESYDGRNVITDSLCPGDRERLAILVVDDDAGISDVLGRALVGYGHQVTLASDGKAAERAAVIAPFDVVITDILMPGTDGFELIGALRRRFPNVRIVAMSGGGIGCGGNYLKIARGLGAHAVLPKPFSVAELTATISAALAA